MSERQPTRSRFAAAPRGVMRGVRMLSTGRWRPPLGMPPLAGRVAPRLIAVGAATAGAGKSTVAANLAVAIAGLGRQVALVDLDLTDPRQHALFGLRALAEAGERATSVRHLRLVRPPAGLADAPDADRRRAALDRLAELDADVVIADLGQAARDDLWTAFAAADRLLVTTGDDAALEATYAFLRQAALRAERRHGDGTRAALAPFAGGLIGNATTQPEQAERFHAFARMVREELGIPLTSLGCLRRSGRIAQSAMLGRPLVARRGLDDDVRLFHQLAELLSVDHAADRRCALDGPLPDPLPPPAPLDIARYQRKHPRFVVDWAATLATDGGPNAVRVQDISESGAAVETTLRLAVGDRGALCFYQLPGQPSIEVIVRNVVPGLSRLGLAFVDGRQITVELARIARERSLAP
jgi:MinD-like ATPase involved in chromosome partitioning or flagellar assembly